MHHVFVFYVHVCGIHIHIIHIVDTGWAMLESYIDLRRVKRGGGVELNTLWALRDWWPWLWIKSVWTLFVSIVWVMRTNESEECRSRGNFMSSQWLVRGDVGLVWEPKVDEGGIRGECGYFMSPAWLVRVEKGDERRGGRGYFMSSAWLVRVDKCEERVGACGSVMSPLWLVKVDEGDERRGECDYFSWALCDM
jgi:hypothetical protein